MVGTGCVAELLAGTTAAENREPTAGVEPATSALRERRSDQLSYVGIGATASYRPSLALTAAVFAA